MGGTNKPSLDKSDRSKEMKRRIYSSDYYPTERKNNENLYFQSKLLTLQVLGSQILKFSWEVTYW